MRWLSIAAICAALSVPPLLWSQASTVPVEDQPAHSIQVSVDEVGLTFHAAGKDGLPVNDLRADEVKLLDNGKPPKRIVAFSSLHDVAIHAGILIDTSESMQAQLSTSRAIATELAPRVLRQKTDQAFVMEFGYISNITQPLTNDAAALTHAIRQAVTGRDNPLGGTALLDTLFRACFNVFGHIDHTVGGNFILLFSDGEDNGSHTALPEVVDICQRSNTAIYVFRAEPNPSLFSGGPRMLMDLASQTGGQVFAGTHSEAEISADLGTVEAELRNQYRLIFNPADLAHDASFHRIELRMPERVQSVTIRSGYYDRRR